MNPRRAALLSAVALVFFGARAEASNALETPGGGVQQMSRGGAWLARADEPIAAFYNPAAMVRHASGAYLGTSLMFRSFCFDRRDANNQPVAPASGFAPAPDPTCSDNPPFPNPQVAVSWHFHKRWAVGLYVGGPHTNAGVEWPDVVQYDSQFVRNADHPAGSRYQLLENKPLAIFPTLSAAFAINKNLSIGAGFSWGIVSVEFAQMAEAVSPIRTEPDDFSNDIKTKLQGMDAFVPGLVASVLWSPTNRLDLSGWFRYSDDIKTSVDLRAQANYYTSAGQVNETAINSAANITEVANAGTFRLPNPMEARLGFRYHHPRKGRNPQQRWVSKHAGWARDAMSQDLFDVEVDLTWAHNSQVDAVEVRLNPGIALNGTVAGATIPTVADSPRNWRDVLGVRVGGEYVPIVDLLAVRAGGFFESKGVDDADLSLDFHQGFRAGVAAGAALRLGAFDLALGYQHTFFGTLDNKGKGTTKTTSGDATTGDYRSRQSVNGGSATSSLNEVALSAVYHF